MQKSQKLARDPTPNLCVPKPKPQHMHLLQSNGSTAKMTVHPFAFFVILDVTHKGEVVDLRVSEMQGSIAMVRTIHAI